MRVCTPSHQVYPNCNELSRECSGYTEYTVYLYCFVLDFINLLLQSDVSSRFSDASGRLRVGHVLGRIGHGPDLLDIGVLRESRRLVRDRVNGTEGTDENMAPTVLEKPGSLGLQLLVWSW